LGKEARAVGKVGFEGVGPFIILSPLWGWRDVFIILAIILSPLRGWGMRLSFYLESCHPSGVGAIFIVAIKYCQVWGVVIDHIKLLGFVLKLEVNSYIFDVGRIWIDLI
jgi:hypothetical protein